MKKLFLLLLIGALLLCACGQVPEEETPEAPEGPAAVEPEAMPAPAGEALSALLGELRETVSIGTAGSSLRAVSMAAKLLDWAEEAELTDEELLSALSPWLGELEDGIPADFLEQLAAVDGMVQLLTGEDAAQAMGLLSDAGAGDCAYPWNEKAFHAMEMLCYGLGPQ